MRFPNNNTVSPPDVIGNFVDEYSQLRTAAMNHPIKAGFYSCIVPLGFDLNEDSAVVHFVHGVRLLISITASIGLLALAVLGINGTLPMQYLALGIGAAAVLKITSACLEYDSCNICCSGMFCLTTAALAAAGFAGLLSINQLCVGVILTNLLPLAVVACKLGCAPLLGICGATYCGKALNRMEERLEKVAHEDHNKFTLAMLEVRNQQQTG